MGSPPRSSMVVVLPPSSAGLADEGGDTTAPFPPEPVELTPEAVAAGVVGGLTTVPVPAPPLLPVLPKPELASTEDTALAADIPEPAAPAAVDVPAIAEPP